MRVVVSGATGTIGRRLVRALDAEVTVLSRDVGAARRTLDASHFVDWDGHSALAPSLFEGVDVVYHLAGEPVAGGRWTEKKKERIVASRVFGTRAIVDAIGSAHSRTALVCASAVGYYGSRGDEILTETSSPGRGFLADVCKRWEAEAARVEIFGARATMLRIGIVLAREGGALEEMLPLFRRGVGGRLGTGEQWMPWIHVDDVVALFRRAGEGEGLSGPVNAVSPSPVRNAEFTKILARAVRRPAVVPAPSFALRLALGELADVVLASQRVLPEKANQIGHTFIHPTLGEALTDLVGHPPQERSLEAR
jgi:uncharacterized protein (TIGR01777 family)